MHSLNLLSKSKGPLFWSTLVITMLYVIYSGHTYEKNAIVSTITIFIIFMIITAIQWWNYRLLQKKIPVQIANLANAIISRLSVFPYESLLIFAVFYLTFMNLSKPFDDPKCYILSYCIVLILTFYLCEIGNIAAESQITGIKSLWVIAIKPHLRGKKSDRIDENELEYSYVPLLNGDTRIQDPMKTQSFEAEDIISDQERSENNLTKNSRWRIWINEEMNRLRGDTQH